MKNKLILIALFALFFTPMLIAVVLHSEWVDWQAPPDKAHGELLEPVVELGEFELMDAGDTARSLNDLLGHWQLVFVVREPCRNDCLETVELMHNIRLAQDRHREEVALVLLSAPALDPAIRQRIAEVDRSLLMFDEAAARALIQRIPGTEHGALYIVDPQGNIIERFGPGADLNGVRKDLDRLLTWTLREQK